MKKSLWVGMVITSALFANHAMAGSYVSCDAKSDHEMDYSDAPSSYGVACHDTDKWQGLGDGWETDREGKWRYRDSSGNWRYQTGYTTGSTPESWDTDSAGERSVVGHDDATDDGVFWRTFTDADGWSDWGNTDNNLTVGGLVQFKFEFSRSIDGNHQYDELKAWMDWNQDGSWDNDVQNDEIIKNVIWDKDRNADNNGDGFDDLLAINNYIHRYPGLESDFCRYYGYDYNTDTRTCNSKEDFRLFYTGEIEIPDILGETWLRVRVTCENSLSSFAVNRVMTPDGYLNQGEVEDYSFMIVNNPPPVDVPEPSSLLIMSPALLLLAGRRRKRK